MRKAVNIFGKEIKIIKKSGMRKNESVYGEYDPDNHTIYIDADLPPKTAREALIHECGHALFHRAGLSQSKITSDLEEIIVEQFAIMFSENFFPSPRLKRVKK